MNSVLFVYATIVFFLKTFSSLYTIPSIVIELLRRDSESYTQSA